MHRLHGMRSPRWASATTSLLLAICSASPAAVGLILGLDLGPMHALLVGGVLATAGVRGSAGENAVDHRRQTS